MSKINKKLFLQIEDFIDKRVVERQTDVAENYKDLKETVIEFCMDVDNKMSSIRADIVDFKQTAYGESFPIQVIQYDAMMVILEQVKTNLEESGIWKIYEDYIAGCAERY